MRKDNITGYTGVHEDKRCGTFFWSLSVNSNVIRKYGYKSKLDAAVKRNECIVANALPNQLSVLE